MTVGNNSVKDRYYHFVEQEHAKRTAQWYLSVLDNLVRGYIAQLVDNKADSIFSYQTADEVKTCIELLKSSDEFMADNKRRKNVMTAALNKYYQFMLEEKK